MTLITEDGRYQAKREAAAVFMAGWGARHDRERAAPCAVFGCQFKSWRNDRLCPRHEVQS